MRKEKHFTRIIDDIRIDFRFEIEDGRIRHFCINVCLIEKEGTEDVFRVDTAHKGLHVQKFWISNEPKYLENKRKDEYNPEFNYWKREVLENFENWVKLYKDKKGERDEKYENV